MHSDDIGIISSHIYAQLRDVQSIYCVIREYGRMPPWAGLGHNNLQLTLTHYLLLLLLTATFALLLHLLLVALLLVA